MKISCDITVMVLIHGDGYGHDDIVGVFSSDAKAIAYLQKENVGRKCWKCKDGTMYVGDNFGSELFVCPKCGYAHDGGYWTEDYEIDEEVLG